MNENSFTPPRFIGSAFLQRREDIFKRLKECVEKCKGNYLNRKELANNNDIIVLELCDSLDESLNYGLRQHGNFVVAAANLFHDIIGNSGSASSSNDASFWDFCQNHLTAYERQRFESLQNVLTKMGRGRAFVRAALNENSLERYLLKWFSDKDLLERYYTSWSLLLDEETSRQLPEIITGLNKILFALKVDAVELDKTTRNVQNVATKEEPIIYAPRPVPLASVKCKRKSNVVDITMASSNDDFIKHLPLATTSEKKIEKVEEILYTKINNTTKAPIELTKERNSSPFDPIQPELEFLKQPLPDVYQDNQTMLQTNHSVLNSTSDLKLDLNSDVDYEDKSDSSSQYSKTSSTHDSNSALLEEQLRELNERYALLETHVAQLRLENVQLVRRLSKYFNESGIDPTSSFAINFLITIPSVKLIHCNRVTSSSYYGYDIHITMRHRLEHWSVLRRYRDFYKLHKTLLRTHPFISAVKFPPKKHFGNKNVIFVEERRQQLQIYLSHLVESLPQVEACKTKEELQRVFPFFRET